MIKLLASAIIVITVIIIISTWPTTAPVPAAVTAPVSIGKQLSNRVRDNIIARGLSPPSGIHTCKS